MTWEAVEASGGITSSFAERAQALLSTHATDPKAYVKALDDLPRFNTAKLEQIKEHLESVGMLDERDPLDGGKLIEQAQLGCRADIAAGLLTLAEVEAMVGFVREVVGV